MKYLSQDSQSPGRAVNQVSLKLEGVMIDTQMSHFVQLQGLHLADWSSSDALNLYLRGFQFKLS